ncbi:hypothetical protein [Photobacterium lutimaris]|uniref:Uncharacterized protein n=1 Tax=Photobacterium lutimaris TaxID=388278 RepID=A0A2T3ITK8_9GAMM|nr:hypothetical protein [Photobacterium lutimaris]PSU31694.1 hypothetical protein C9I99_21135 [Photobacterium lutimaris]TDR72669.1 hypothetical protein DFP78_113145 [Photobacterium lutimaris]
MEITYTEQESKLTEQLRSFAPEVADQRLNEVVESVITSANKEVYSLLAITGKTVIVFELGLGHNFNTVKHNFSSAQAIIEIRPNRNKWFKLQACKIKMSRALKKSSELEVGSNLASVRGMLTVHDDGTLPNQPNYWRRWVQKFKDAGNEVMYRYMVEALRTNQDLDPNQQKTPS